MQHLTFKKILLAVSVSYLIIGSIRAEKAYALNDDYTGYCDEMSSLTLVGAPAPTAILCPIARLLNVLIFSAGAVLVIFIFIASVKYSMSQGDPKAVEASRQTLTTAVVGFIVVIGVWTILTIMKNVLGLSGDSLIDPFGMLSSNLANLLRKFGIN